MTALRTGAPLLAALGLLLSLAGAPVRPAAQEPLPQRLSDTGLHSADAVVFTPRHVLWTDGAAKRRWLSIPAGAQIDARDADRWQFPPGTRLWKEFAFGGRPVETRYIERAADGSWRFATYLWDADGKEAWLAPERGVRALQVQGAPGGRYDIPSRGDCIACHGSAPVPVLGASALLLGTGDGATPGAGLRALVERGWLAGLDPRLLADPPQVAGRTPLERAALGYLHANCGHCHNTSGRGVPLALTLWQGAADPQRSRQQVLASLLRGTTRYAGTADAPQSRLVVPGAPDHSLLHARMRTRNPRVQMPPLGTRAIDEDGLALVARWIAQDLSQPQGEPQ